MGCGELWCERSAEVEDAVTVAAAQLAANPISRGEALLFRRENPPGLFHTLRQGIFPAWFTPGGEGGSSNPQAGPNLFPLGKFRKARGTLSHIEIPLGFCPYFWKRLSS